MRMIADLCVVSNQKFAILPRGSFQEYQIQNFCGSDFFCSAGFDWEALEESLLQAEDSSFVVDGT